MRKETRKYYFSVEGETEHWYTLEDVRSAIQRSKVIMQRNRTNGCVEQKYKGYSYYKENPSLSIWEVVEKILKDCGLL